jgi:hypothetical protein
MFTSWSIEWLHCIPPSSIVNELPLFQLERICKTPVLACYCRSPPRLQGVAHLAGSEDNVTP